MRTGIVGGSFDPVHQQHLRIAMAAFIECQLDEVWFVPVFQAVHKTHHCLLDYQHRRNLLSLALGDFPQFRISDIEMELGGPSYTVRTVSFLKERYPERQFYLIIGGDSLAELSTWREAERLATMTEFIVAERPGFERISPLPDAVIHWVNCNLSEVSSSSIRQRLARHEFAGIEIDLPELHAILQHNHYGCLGDDYHRWLKLVTRKQMEAPVGLQNHMQGVARLAVKYALEADCDPRAALIAGMAHDLFRDATDAEIIGLVSAAGFSLRELEQQTPMLAHGPAAAAWLLSNAPDIDPAIVAAVRDHTFPDADSPVLTRVMATADTLESSRGIAERDQLREADLSFADRYLQLLKIKKTSHS